VAIEQMVADVDLRAYSRGQKDKDLARLSSSDGGTMAEFIKDFSIGLPAQPDLAKMLMQETKVYKCPGHRKPAANFEGEEILVQFFQSYHRLS